MMKKLSVSACIFFIIMLLVSCAGTRGLSPTSDPSSAVYSGARGDSPVYTYTVLDRELQNAAGQVSVPWRENAAEMAVKTGTIRFYFMSGEKQNYSTNAGTKFGDSCLIAFPDGTIMLIDAGMPNYAPVLKANLEALGVKKIDYAVLSHFHDDHYGAYWSGDDAILYNFEIGTFIWNGAYNTSDNAKANFQRAIKANGIESRILKAGDKMTIGDCTIEIFNPLNSDEIKGQQLIEAMLNNSSLLMKISYGEFDALFGGDIYVEQEMKLISMYPEGTFDVEMVKTNHHGTTASSCKEWIAATTPRVAVASSGNPLDSTVYGWFSKVGARVFGDAVDGYVRVVSDGYNCEVTTGRTRTTSIYDNFDRISEQVYPSK